MIASAWPTDSCCAWPLRVSAQASTRLRAGAPPARPPRPCPRPRPCAWSPCAAGAPRFAAPPARRGSAAAQEYGREARTSRFITRSCTERIQTAPSGRRASVSDESREPSEPDAPALSGIQGRSPSARKSNLNANCMIRGSPAVRIRPKFVLLSAGRRVVEVRLVHHVEDLPPELERARAEPEVPGDRQVVLQPRGPDERVRLQRAVGARRRRREGGQVQVVVHGCRRRRRRPGPAPRAGRPCPTSALSTPVVTEKRLPLCHRTSGAICQSPKSARIARVRERRRLPRRSTR